MACSLPSGPPGLLAWCVADLQARVGDSAAESGFLALLTAPPSVSPALHGVRVLERLAVMALERGDVAQATIYALRAIRDGRSADFAWSALDEDAAPAPRTPADAPSETLRLRALIMGGDLDEARFDLELLINEQPHSPSARRLAGEVAWADGDAPRALEHWEAGASPRPRLAVTTASIADPTFWREERERDAYAWCAAAVAVIGAREPDATPSPCGYGSTAALPPAAPPAIEPRYAPLAANTATARRPASRARTRSWPPAPGCPAPCPPAGSTDRSSGSAP